MLTAKGAAKIESVIAAARVALEIGIAREALEARPRIAARAPSESEEAQLISEGTAAGAGTIGTPEGGRFERTGAFVSLRAAIEEDPVEAQGAGPIASAGTGHPARINARTGFFWGTRHRGVQGPSLPWNEHYVEAMEDGGTWVVVPRGPWGLEPEPGVTAVRMVKTLPPHRMFAGELLSSRGAMRDSVVSAIRLDVRAVGLP